MPRAKHPTPKKPPTILFCKNKYSPMVKVENWDFHIHAEKKDNYVYRDQLSNMVSTYNRLGYDDHGTSMTETRHMLAQIYTKTEPIYSFKPLVNFTSYPCTDTPGRNKLMKNADLAQLAPDFGLTVASPPPLLNRTIRSDCTQNYGTAPPRGFYQCLDTHTPIGHIRQLRLQRYQSFNPATCIQNFPNVSMEQLMDKPIETQEVIKP